MASTDNNKMMVDLETYVLREQSVMAILTAEGSDTLQISMISPATFQKYHADQIQNTMANHMANNPGDYSRLLDIAT